MLPTLFVDARPLKRVLERSSVTHPSLSLSWFERGTKVKNSYLQVLSSIPARPKTEKSNQYGFETIDPQARVLNYCFQ